MIWEKNHKSTIVQNDLKRRNTFTASVCIAGPADIPVSPQQTPALGAWSFFCSSCLCCQLAEALKSPVQLQAGRFILQMNIAGLEGVLSGIFLFSYFFILSLCLQKSNLGPLNLWAFVSPAGFYHQGNAANELSLRSATAHLFVCVIGRRTLLGSPIETCCLLLLKMILIKQDVVLLVWTLWLPLTLQRVCAVI